MATDRLAAMETFVRVVDAGSFSAAAVQLNIGQSAVSKTITQLEERLGVRLLQRSTRSLSVTEAGKNFYDRARIAIENVEEAETAARGEAGLSGVLRVSASVCFARLHVLPRLPEILALHPDMDIEVVCDDRFVNLVEEGMDLALRTGALTDSSLTARKIGESHLRVMGSAAYFAKNGAPKTPQDLAAHQTVVMQRNGVTRDEFAFRRGDAGALGEVDVVKVKGRIKVSSGEGLREAVLSGLGIAIISEWLFTPEIGAGLVQVVLPEWTLPTLDLWAVYPPGKVTSAKARAFVPFIERSMARDQIATRATPAAKAARLRSVGAGS